MVSSTSSTVVWLLMTCSLWSCVWSLQWQTVFLGLGHVHGHIWLRGSCRRDVLSVLLMCTFLMALILGKTTLLTIADLPARVPQSPVFWGVGIKKAVLLNIGSLPFGSFILAVVLFIRRFPVFGWRHSLKLKGTSS